jgi:hypothetical protein
MSAYKDWAYMDAELTGKGIQQCQELKEKWVASRAVGLGTLTVKACADACGQTG